MTSGDSVMVYDPSELRDEEVADAIKRLDDHDLLTEEQLGDLVLASSWSARQGNRMNIRAIHVRDMAAEIIRLRREQPSERSAELTEPIDGKSE
jgi:hypothetical protein